VSLSDDTSSKSFFCSKNSLISFLPLDEKEDNLISPKCSNLFSFESLVEKEKELYFEVVYPKWDFYSLKEYKKLILLNAEEKEETFLKRKRLPFWKPKMDNQEKMLKKIKWDFLITLW